MNKLEVLEKTWAGENCAINNITKSIAHKKRHFIAPKNIFISILPKIDQTIKVTF